MFDESKAFRQHHLEGQAEHAVEHAGYGAERIFLQRNYPAEGGRLPGVGGELQCVESEVQPPRAQCVR